MKKLMLAVTLMLVVLSGCNNKPSEESFIEDSSNLYVQIFKDGEQSDEVAKIHQEYTSEYKQYSDHDLYKKVDGLYKSLGTEDSSEYLASVMNLLNEYRTTN